MGEKSKKSHSVYYEHFFPLVLDLLCAVDGSGRFIILNSEWERTMGYSLENLAGHSFMDLVHREDIEKTQQALDRLAAGEEALSFTNRCRCRDGTYRWLKWRLSPRKGLIYAAARDITGHILSRQEVERFQDVLNNSLNEIYIVDAFSLKFTFANARARENLGYSEEELYSMTPYAINSPHQRKALETLFKDLKQGKDKEARFKTDHYRKNGSSYPAEVRLKYLERNGPSFYIAIVLDVTDKRQWETVPGESGERYKRLVENADDIIYRMELLPERKNTFVNQAVERVTGYTPQEYYEDPDLGLKIVHPEDRPLLEESWKDKTFFNRTLRLRLITKDGRVVWTEQHNTPLYNKKGHLVAIGGIVRDITERVEMVERLNNERKRFEVTLYSIGDAVIATDIRGNITLMNPVAERLLGISHEEARGLPLDDIFFAVDEEERSPLENPISLIIQKREKSVTYSSCLLIGKESKETLIEASAFPIIIEGKNPTGAVLVFRDISDKRAAQDHLIKAQRLESLGLLAGRIAHDFNNLLGGLFGYIDIARQRLQKEDLEKGLEYLDKAQSIYERILSLTGRFLTFSKGGSPVRKTGELKPAINRAMKIVLKGTSVSVRKELEKSLWPADFDEGQINQVFINLFINALQAMKEEGTLYIRAYNRELGPSAEAFLPSGRYIVVEVEDNGEGIPAQYLQKIFDPFFTTRKTGSGLGLTTSDSIIKRHGGAITVRSKLGEGSTFSVYLPASEHERPESGKRVDQLFHGEGRALVLDDEPSIREVTGEMLRNLGFLVEEAEEGEQALKMITSAAEAETPYTLIITDLTIHAGKSGKEIIGDIRKIYPEIPVIVSTGYSEDPILNNPPEYGFTAGLLKPFTIDDVSGVLNRIFGTKGK
ncbi:MAG TPA: PAS domain S-box protein [Firmicutes bacterium]|nr:PAS domain S-box protein [Bacillota bacterium]